MIYNRCLINMFLSLSRKLFPRWNTFSLIYLSNQKSLLQRNFSAETENKQNDHNKIKQPSESYKKFSLSESNPSQMPLHRIAVEEKEKSISLGRKIFLLALSFGICGFVTYAFLFSELHVEIEDNLIRTVPGYVDYMKQIMPDYEERLEKARAKQAKNQ